MIEHVFDLAAHETERLAAVLVAQGSGFDPDAVLAGETAARLMLYSGLDKSQQKTYDELVVAGVLP